MNLNRTGSKLWSAVLCGGLSLIADFILLPHVFTLITVLGCPIPDPIWISVMVLISVIIAIHMLERNVHIPARYVWVGLPVQYLILIVFAGPMRKVSPIASDSWTYMGGLCLAVQCYDCTICLTHCVARLEGKAQQITYMRGAL